jgi:molybdopterin-guanine dinucleotide biosynthesis protein A
MHDLPRLGLVLLTGGKGERMGGPKHDRPHPGGGSWGGHLVQVFRAVVGKGPEALLGAALPDHPELVPLEDPREGPAVALRAWASAETRLARRWWVVACDQVDWTPAALRRWLEAAEAADPEGGHWLLGAVEGRLQPLGGFLGGGLLSALASSPSRALYGLVEAVPSLDLAGPPETGWDLDTPADVAAWEKERGTC